MGMPGNMNNLMKQAQKMQRQMEENQKALEEKEFTATVGGGAVTAVVTGAKVIKSLKIKPEVVDPDDVEMLEDLVLTCLNDAFNQADNKQSEQMGKFNIPGLM